ncbi:alpha/beta fold hydrolase [Mycetocola zhadangensis]|uniref:Alpha/beta hydrolase n=1 Tax=Mycetocola zhadangensis TaxID=1164595 RepID=A0A3L7ISU0_9MICO|nr:alpha/beta hydrolase [Mycetocola zhadangensis]RLQ81257.1 alpha/beta hydrolase [Mycetocola zhadangensis]GGF03326.1 alpha/beta hydrolase [Mycetocola zhadangensis]
MSPRRISTYSRADLTFDVTDSGPLAGPPVVLLHGFPANRHSFDAVVPILNEAGLRTLVPDQRGYSDGARPRRRRDYRAIELQRDVLALVNAAGGERAHLVGHDWGGAIAWQLAASAPERLTGITVLSTPHPTDLVRSLVTSDQLLRSFYILMFQVPWLPEILLRRRLPGLLRWMGLSQSAAAMYGEFMSKSGRLTGGLHWYRGMWLPDRRAPRQRTVTVPTTYLWGNRDQALGRRAAELSGQYVRGEYRYVELDENHWLPENAPKLVASEIIAAVSRDPVRYQTPGL